MFTNDRDLLVLEPRLFFDVAWTAQRLIDSAAGGSINANGDTLTITSGNLINLDIGAGYVAIVAGTPLEVTERIDATSLKVSRLRASTADAGIPVATGSALKVTIHTFRPQIKVIHDQLLRMLGIEPDFTDPPSGTPTEASITNPRALAHAEALGALHLIFASASAAVGSDSPLWVKANMYRDRFAAERKRLTADIDLNNDGIADATRRANIFQFIRA